MTINLKIENTSIEAIEFALPEMNLSSARAKMDRKLFQLEIDASELLLLLKKDYSQWIIESKQDDEQCGGPQDELAEAGYPELSNVLGHQQLLELVIGDYLFDKLIAKFSEPSKQTKFWCDQVTSCTYDSQKIIINGICYSHKDT